MHLCVCVCTQLCAVKGRVGFLLTQFLLAGGWPVGQSEATRGLALCFRPFFFLPQGSISRLAKSLTRKGSVQMRIRAAVGEKNGCNSQKVNLDFHSDLATILLFGSTIHAVFLVKRALLLRWPPFLTSVGLVERR